MQSWAQLEGRFPIKHDKKNYYFTVCIRKAKISRKKYINKDSQMKFKSTYPGRLHKEV